MTILGAGLQPAGSSYAGFGEVPPTEADSSVLLADAMSGGILGSRQIDPVTGDYVMNATGRLAGMNNVQQLVQLAVCNAGPELGTIDRLNDGFENAATAILTAACAPIVSQGLIAVVGVRNVKLGVSGGLGSGQAMCSFLWRDLTSGESRYTEF